MQDLSSIIKVRHNDDYQRENFDLFLKHIKFSYKIPSIHVAGTNGKGSVCNYLSNIYRTTYKKIGLFTSPSLFEINELIQIDGINISDESITKYINSYKKDFEKFDLSFFEIMTFIAFLYFQDNDCALAIIECGMGGELDATNIFTPILSIITSVSMEHTLYLGKSLSEITLHKAGIIKKNIPVLIGNLSEESINVITDIALENKSKIYSVNCFNNLNINDNGCSFDYLTLKECCIPSKATYSVNDACVAIEATKIINNLFPINEQQIKMGLQKTFMSCRFDIISINPLVLIDGAHNPEAMINLKSSIETYFHDKHIKTIFACFKDKNVNALLSICGEMSDELILTTFNHYRARKKDDYFLYGDEYKFFEDPLEAFRDSLQNCENELLIITGSLAFAAYMKKNIKI